MNESESESDRSRARCARILELRAQGLSFEEIGAQVETVRGSTPHPMGAQRARVVYEHALRVEQVRARKYAQRSGPDPSV